MNPILGAISAGYTIKEIINFIANLFPGSAGKISQAISSGYSPEEIIKHLQSFKTEDFKKINKRGNRSSKFQLPEDEKQPLSSMQKANKLWYGNEEEFVPEEKSSFLPNLGKAALGAGTAMALKHALPTSLKNNKMPEIQQNQIETQPQQPPVNVNAQNITQPVNPVQPKGISNPREYLEKAGIKDKVDELLKTGNDPEAVAAALNIGNKGRRATGEIDPELVSVIDAYSKESSSDLLPKSNEVVEEVIQTKESKPMAKSETVVSPNGIGEIKEIRNGQAIIDVDGKLHKVKQDELEPLTFKEEEVANAYDNLFKLIPEEHRSGFIQWSGYDENRNVLGFIPRGGKYEELENITPEEAKMIKEGSGTARTTGEKREGLWVQGEDTRGGVISQIIHDRRKKHKEADENQLKLPFDLAKKEKEDKGMKPIFDELEYARNLSRQRDRKKVLEERAKKKKEKDEAKKRKK